MGLFPLLRRNPSRLEQSQLDLAAILVDFLHFDHDLVAEPELPLGLLATQPVFPVEKLPVVSPDRGDGDESLDEMFFELDEKSEGGDARDSPLEHLTDLVEHEDHLLPLEHFPVGRFRTPFGIGRLDGGLRMLGLDSRQSFSDESAAVDELTETAVNDQIGIPPNR